MSLIDTLTRRAGGLAGGVRQSVRRARLDGELRLLQRQRRATLELLGERTFELVRQGRLAAAELGPQVADVESKLMEIDAKAGEIEALREDGDEVDSPVEDEPARSNTRRIAGLRRLIRRS